MLGNYRLIQVTTMDKRGIIFSFVLMILSYYIITKSLFLTFEDTGELLLFVMLILSSIYLVIQSLIEIISFKQRKLLCNITNVFCFISSLIFLLVSAYAALFM
jgi:hypothetical protein